MLYYNSVGTVEEEIIRRAQEKRKVDMKVIQAGMFNNKSTASERKEFLESVMRQGTQLIGRDVPDNEELNRFGEQLLILRFSVFKEINNKHPFVAFVVMISFQTGSQ